MSLSARDLSMIAQGWDAAVEAMRYEDGTPVEIVRMVNPYRPTTQPMDSEPVSNRYKLDAQPTVSDHTNRSQGEN